MNAKMNGTIKNIKGKYFTLDLGTVGDRRLHIDSNHCWKDFDVKEGDEVTVNLHPTEQNAVTRIEKRA